MTATPREIVYQTLDRAGPPRAPRDLWYLPSAEARYPVELPAMLADYPPDFLPIGGHLREAPATRGDVYAVGHYTSISEVGLCYHTKLSFVKRFLTELWYPRKNVRVIAHAKMS